MLFNPLDLENLVVLITKESHPRFKQIAKVKSKDSKTGWEFYGVQYSDGEKGQILEDDARIFYRFCDPKDNKRISDSGEDLVSLREEFKKLNQQDSNSLFCKQYGLLIYGSNGKKD